MDGTDRNVVRSGSCEVALQKKRERQVMPLSFLLNASKHLRHRVVEGFRDHDLREGLGCAILGEA